MKQNNKNTTCNRVDESHQHNFKRKKPHREEYMLFDFTYINFKKWQLVSEYINHQVWLPLWERGYSWDRVGSSGAGCGNMFTWCYEIEHSFDNFFTIIP